MRLAKVNPVWSLTVGLSFLFHAGHAIAQQADPCQEPNQTQRDLNGCEARHFNEADAELNRV